MKIKTRLSIWYFAVSVFIVLLLSLSIYYGMQRLLYKTIDDDLEIFADMIESSYNPFLNQFEEIVWRLESAKRYQEVYLIVYNARGLIEFASPMTQFIKFDLPVTRDEAESGFTRSSKLTMKIPVLKTDDQGNVIFRGISRRMYFRDKPIGWIQAGLPITSIEQDLDNLFNVIMIVNAFAVLLVGLGGYFIIARFLFPIKLITNKAKEISSKNLNERIEIQNEQDELGQLTITLNNLLERLNKAFETQRRFMADAAHELKTPLTLLRTHWENELNNPDLEDAFKERLVQDVETIGRLNQMINKLLFLAQTEDVTDQLELSQVKLDDFLRDLINDTKILAELKHQQLTAVELEPVSIQADRNQLYQLFFNLIDNAIKYTPEKGKIMISLKGDGQNVKIKIHDTGSGIDGEKQAFIFERFYRVDKDRSRKTGGSGLGLSICKLIAESHKGSISVESQVHHGSTFTVILPVEQR
ncbi:MAG: HAMP domain-containing protein [Calditrichae bacterium]|nr:HAMP domain-containing protein [Calditrichia bacterium]